MRGITEQPESRSDRSALSRLSVKQRACLDLVLEHCTSKQIARKLGISPYTVDQRLGAAREILGVSTRIEAAQRYAELKGLYEPTIYKPNGISDLPVYDAGSAGPQQAFMLTGDDAETVESELIDVSPDWSRVAEPRRVARVFVGRDGIGLRIRLLIIMTLGIMSAVLLGLAIAEALDGLIDQFSPVGASTSMVRSETGDQ